MVIALLDSLIEAEIVAQRLPSDFNDTIQRFYAPLAEAIARSIEQRKSSACTPMLIGVFGSQGSGKSTFAAFLKLLLEHQHKLPCVIMSLDDFYLTRSQRQQLASDVHPLLITRGVPGTHDIALLEETLRCLKNVEEREDVKIPVFSKAKDDRAPVDEWQVISTQPKVVVLEGWCVGVRPQTDAHLIAPINDLEAQDDSHGRWRQFVNQQLEQSYLPIYAQFNQLIALLAPSFDCVHEWRLLQETKLVKKLEASNESTDATMSNQQIRRFVAHYQRLTEHALATLPAYADWCLTIDKNHRITSLEQASVDRKVR